MHCFCVCSGSALLGDLGITRSVESDCLSCLILGFSLPFIVLHRFLLETSYYVVFYNYFLRVCCAGLVVSTYQVIG